MSEKEIQSFTTDVEYRDVPGFPGYRVGSDGSVWSCRGRGGRRGALEQKWRKLSPRKGSDGYVHTSLRAGSNTHQFLVHRLVLESFVGPCPVGMEARHASGSKADNRLANLSWGTAKENAEDRDRHGKTRRGSSNGHAKLTEADIPLVFQRRAAGWTHRRIAVSLGVSETTIITILSGKKWGHVPRPQVEEVSDA